MIRFLSATIVLSGLIVSCTTQSSSGTLSGLPDSDYVLERVNDTLYHLSTRSDTTGSYWALPYPVYRFETGDIDGDGVQDAIVGVIKTTRFDSVPGKRLFIFKNYEDLVRPLWLGSRLGKPIVDFRVVHTDDGDIIRSIELEQSGRVLIAEYKWRKFGLEFINFVAQEVEYSTAETILNQSHEQDFLHTSSDNRFFLRSNQQKQSNER